MRIPLGLELPEPFVVRAVRRWHSVTFILDHSVNMYETTSGATVADWDGDANLRVADSVLLQIFEAVAKLDDDTSINFVLAGTQTATGGIGDVRAFKGGLKASDFPDFPDQVPTEAQLGVLRGLVQNELDQADGTATVDTQDPLASVNFGGALEKAKSLITSEFGAAGADEDDIVIITASDGTDSFFEYDDAAEQAYYENLLADLENNVGADIDAILVNSDIALTEIDSTFDFDPAVIAADNAIDPLLLVALDSDGVIKNANDVDDFGLEDLLVAPTVTPEFEVVSLTVNGFTYGGLVDNDPNALGFQFKVDEITDDPLNTSASLTYNTLDDQGSVIATDTVDITSLLVADASASDTFNFDLTLV